jgi:hypothetical protein
MAVINKSIEIPADRRLRLELALPEDLPPGRAELRLTINPIQGTGGSVPFKSLFGCLKDRDVFKGDSMELQRAMRNEW